MKVYGEYHGGDRKATVTKESTHWNDFFDRWEVELSVGGRTLQKVVCRSEAQAAHLAEDFVNGHGSAPTLLNEHISNGQ